MKPQNIQLAFMQHIDGLYKKMPELNYFQLLNVKPDDGVDRVKRQFLKLAQIYHPDLHRDLPREYQLKLDKIFKLMNEAYRVLSDPRYRLVKAKPSISCSPTKSSNDGTTLKSAK